MEEAATYFRRQSHGSVADPGARKSDKIAGTDRGTFGKSTDLTAQTPSENYAKDVRKQLDTWEERITKLRSDVASPGGETRLKADSLTNKSITVIRDVDSLEKACLSRNDSQWRKIRNRIQSNLNDIERTSQHAVAE